DTAGVYHYAPDRHALEMRCAFAAEAWRASCGEPARTLLVALTSIHWREAWKDGERAFRYCQHDLGHAVAALLGIDRDDDYVEAEREEPGWWLLVTAGDEADRAGLSGLVDAARRGEWHGRASQLSEDHVEWTFIDEVARATGDPGRNLSGLPDLP